MPSEVEARGYEAAQVAGTTAWRWVVRELDEMQEAIAEAMVVGADPERYAELVIRHRVIEEIKNLPDQRQAMGTNAREGDE